MTPLPRNNSSKVQSPKSRPRLVVSHSTCPPLSSSPPREQLCNRSCSDKHTQGENPVTPSSALGCPGTHEALGALRTRSLSGQKHTHILLRPYCGKRQLYEHFGRCWVSAEHGRHSVITLKFGTRKSLCVSCVRRKRRLGGRRRNSRPLNRVRVFVCFM